MNLSKKSFQIVVSFVLAGVPTGSTALAGVAVEYWKVPGTQVRTLQDADAIIAANAPIAIGDASILNFVDNYDAPPFTGRGFFSGDSLFPGVAAIQGHPSGDDFVVRVRGELLIPHAGAYTLGSAADDGLQFTLDGTVVLQFQAAPFQGYESLDLAAGWHAFEAVYFAAFWSDSLELFARSGSATQFDQNFRLLGDGAHGGLAITPEPSACVLLVLGALLRRRW